MLPQTESAAVAAMGGTVVNQPQKKKVSLSSLGRGHETPVVYLEIEGATMYPLSVVRKTNRFRRMYHKKPQGKSCA